MKLPVPTTIRCGSHVYRVVCDAEQSKRLADEGNHGDVNHRTQTVCINMVRPFSARTEALIHEGLHVADAIFKGKGGERLSEDEISRLSEGLAQVLRGWGIEFDWEGSERKEL